MKRTRYVIIYEIKVKGTKAKQEENSFIYEATCEEFSLRAVKSMVLKIHGYDETMHYVRILNVIGLIDEKSLPNHLTNTVNQVIVDT